MASAVPPALEGRVSGGGTGTAPQARRRTLDDLDRLEGGDEVLNARRPDVVSAIPTAVVSGADADAIGSHAFGTDLANPGEHDIAKYVDT